MSRIAVIGAGIAGLSAAYQLQRDGFEPTVFEASNRVGGVIHSERSDGFLVEHGPNSIQSRSGALEGMIDELGLRSRSIRASESARTRYIVKDGRPEPAPLAPTRLLTSRLFGPGAKFRLMREPFVPASDPGTEESVAAFIRRRLGPEFLNYGMNPFVAGVFAGDAERLSLRYAFPDLYEMEQESGSILKGQIDRRRNATAAAETHRMFTFQDGLAELPLALAGRIERVRLDSPVDVLTLQDSVWKAGSESFEAVIFAAPLYRLAEIGLPSQVDVSLLINVSYPPLSVVALGYERADVRHSLEGFGMLVPEVERRYRILGTLFTSSVFSGRAPRGHVILTSFVGGMRAPALAQASSEDLFAFVHDDLSQLLRIEGGPRFKRHVYWKQSIPQYNVGYGSVLQAIDHLERTSPGWFMAGSYRSGISVGEAADSGVTAARRCAQYLRR